MRICRAIAAVNPVSALQLDQVMAPRWQRLVGVAPDFRFVIELD